MFPEGHQAADGGASASQRGRGGSEETRGRGGGEEGGFRERAAAETLRPGRTARESQGKRIGSSHLHNSVVCAAVLSH